MEATFLQARNTVNLAIFFSRILREGQVHEFNNFARIILIIALKKKKMKNGEF